MGRFQENQEYREAMDEARGSALAADSASTDEARAAWAMSATAWVDIAREIREAQMAGRPVMRGDG